MKQELPVNITNFDELRRSKLFRSTNQRIHLGVAGPGQVTDDAVFLGAKGSTGILVSYLGNESDIDWGDVMELWPIVNITNLKELEESGMQAGQAIHLLIKHQKNAHLHIYLGEIRTGSDLGIRVSIGEDWETSVAYDDIAELWPIKQETFVHAKASKKKSRA